MIRERATERHAGMTESANKIWLAGLGALAVAQEEGGKLFANLVKRGRQYESKVGMPAMNLGVIHDTRDKAAVTIEKLGKSVDAQVTAALHRLGVPTRDEISMLSKRVEMLTASVEKLKTRTTRAVLPATKVTETAGAGPKL